MVQRYVFFLLEKSFSLEYTLFAVHGTLFFCDNILNLSKLLKLQKKNPFFFLYFINFGKPGLMVNHVS